MHVRASVCVQKYLTHIFSPFNRNKEFVQAMRKVWWEVLVYLGAKLILLPFLCMLVLLIFDDLRGMQARAAVYVFLTCFSHAHKHTRCQAEPLFK